MSKLEETKNTSKYLIGCLDNVLSPQFWYYLKWVDMLRYLTIKSRIGIENMNLYHCV